LLIPMLGRPGAALRRLRPRPAEAPAAAGRRRQRGTPPDAVGIGPLLSAPGLRLGVVVIIRDEAPYLEEWLAYHHGLGVQHFFVYDNGSRDALHEVSEPWVNHGLVTLVHWPLPGGQMDAYSHALRFYGPSVDWLAFFDVDEFLVPLVDEDIPAMLGRWPQAADVRVPRVDFGFSGHREPPEGLTIEAYTEVADVFGRDPAKPPRVKTVLQPRSVSAMGIHTATVADIPRDAAGRPVPHETVGPACHPFVQLNHYYTRSFAEFEAKRFRGSATGRIARPAIPFDLPTLRVDQSALRFAERTRQVMALMRSLEPSPYHYGSQLALRQFPHFNDLGLFAEFAVANVAAGEPEPRREPRLRLENRWPGTGFVGELSGIGHQPRRGDLSLSVHLAPLLERARGRLEASWAGQPDEVAATLRFGTARPTEEGWHLLGARGVAEVRVPIDDAGRRRCYALGFVLRTEDALSLQLELRRPDGSAGPATDVHLVGAGTYAGVVEFEARPDLVGTAIVGWRMAAGECLVHDLFVMSYG
jgi:hypothetical protein